MTFSYNANYEFLAEPFEIDRVVTLPIGAYQFNDVQVSYSMGPQRTVSGSLNASRGEFYSGDHSSLGNAGRVKLTSQLAIEPRVSVDRVNLPQGGFTTKLAGARTTYTISPRMFASALMQYNSITNTLETNARFRWNISLAATCSSSTRTAGTRPINGSPRSSTGLRRQVQPPVSVLTAEDPQRRVAENPPARRQPCASSSSTSNTRVAFGGITPPAPALP